MASKKQAELSTRTRGFSAIPKWVTGSGFLAKMRPVSAKVYIALWYFADYGTGTCWPTLKTLAETTGVSETSVLTGITELIEFGLLLRTSGLTRRRYRSNLYQLVIQNPKTKITSGESSLAPEQFSRKADRTTVDGVHTPPNGVYTSQFVDPTPQQLATSHPKDADKQEIEARDEHANRSVAAVISLLVAQDFGENDARRILEKSGASAERVQEVIGMANQLAEGSELKNRQGFIRKALIDNYHVPAVPKAADAALKLRQAQRDENERFLANQRADQQRVDKERARFEQVLRRLPREDLEQLANQAWLLTCITVRNAIGELTDPIASPLWRAEMWGAANNWRTRKSEREASCR